MTVGIEVTTPTVLTARGTRWVLLTGLFGSLLLNALLLLDLRSATSSLPKTLDLFENLEHLDFLGVGAVVGVLGDAQQPDTWIECDGRSLHARDWPDLYARVGLLLRRPGDPDATFRIPDLRGTALWTGISVDFYFPTALGYLAAVLLPPDATPDDDSLTRIRWMLKGR